MKLRGGLPMVVLMVLLVTVPTFEIWLLLQVAGQIGGWPTLGILVVEALLGAWLMRREGRRAWAALTQAFGTGRIPSGELTDAALVLVGGVLLMLPGFATDIVGFLFLLPLTRPAARRLVAFFVARRISRLSGPSPTARRRGDVIEGETVEDPGSEPTVIRGEIDR
nr:FxsA family protein [uncultured Friedmanniella sp.]